MNGGTLRSDSTTPRTYAGSLTVGGNVTIGDATNNGLVTLSGPVTISAATRTLTVNGEVSVTGTIGDGGSTFGITKSGSGVLTLSGNNTYSGLTTISSGTLRVAGANPTSGATTLSSGVLQIAAAAPLASGTLTLTSGTLSSDGSTARQLANPLSFGGNVTLGDATNAGPLTLAGTGTGTAMRTLTVASDVTLSGLLSGALGITKAGAGVLTVTNASNGYTGGTTLNAGRIRVGSNSALGGAAGTVTLFSGALSSDGTDPRSLANNFSVTGNVTLGNATDSGALTLTGNTLLTGNRTVTFDSDVTLSGVLGEQGAGRVLTKDGSAVFTLANAVSYTGGTVLNAGRIRLGIEAALGSGGVTLAGGGLSSDGLTARTVANAVSLTGDVTLGNAADSGTLTFTGTSTLTGNRTITVASDVVMTSRVVDGGSGYGLTKTGPAKLTFSGTSTFTGPLNVNSGTVFVPAGGVLAATGMVNVNATGILAGSGTVGTLAVNDGGTVTPGNSPGAIWSAAAVFAAGGSYNWQLTNATGTAGSILGWDLIAVTGTGTLDLTNLSALSTFNLNTWTLSSTNPDVNGAPANYVSGTTYRFPIVSVPGLSSILLPAGLGTPSFDQDLSALFLVNTAAVNGTGGWLGDAPSAGAMSVRIGLDGQSIDLVVVPEPDALASAAAIMAVLAGVWRRHGRRRS